MTTPRKLPTCNGAAIPQVELTYKKNSCVRGASPLTLGTPDAIAQWMGGVFGCRPTERVYAIYFNVRNEAIGLQLISDGGLSGAPVDLRVLFGMAMQLGASALVLVHNHPSGIPAPSAEDDQLTAHVIEGAKILQLRLLDHLIIARGGTWFSYLMERRGPFNGAAEFAGIY